MLMYNLIEYRDNYSKISGILWQYYRYDPNSNIVFIVIQYYNINMVYSDSFPFKINVAGKTPAVANTREVKQQCH